MKWIALTWHRLTSATVGVYLAKARAIAEADYAEARDASHLVWECDGYVGHDLLAKASARLKADVKGLEDLAEHELAAIESEVAALQMRVEHLLDAGLAVGERTIDALCLHAHLTNAVEKATPPVNAA